MNTQGLIFPSTSAGPKRSPVAYQHDFLQQAPVEETPGYLTEQLLTYIGNKRALIPEIDQVTTTIRQRLGGRRLRILDAFSGSGVVARYFKRHAEFLATIDLEEYAAVTARCYLANSNAFIVSELAALVSDLNRRVDSIDLPMGFIEELYAPRDSQSISKEDRVFYTRRNARRLDNYRRMISQAPPDLMDFLLGPLLSEASIHANTSGVFKGFHKDRHSKIGRFGGTNGDALKRILGDIELSLPILSRFDCDVCVYCGDTNRIAPTIPNLDIVYLDPPYNQHPYGSNYFMLNLLVAYQRPTHISKVSGIPIDWKRSDYNVRTQSAASFQKLVESLDARYLLVSFNDEGFIHRSEMLSILSRLGHVTVVEIKYNTYRGCRNIQNRKKHVTEHMFLVER